ncbi:hypothetical protein [Paenibacillus sp. NPDC058174]|uniref:hypothetical protein n=1 Tax=Paenibacillus sp. NPDC058174 TaxID=3346366 RepID=UPI0036DC12D1
MYSKAIKIREVTSNDDLVYLLQLINETLQRYVKNTVYYLSADDYLKDRAADQNMYVAISDENIVAVTDIRLSSSSRNGVLTYGFVDGYEFVLNELIEKCGIYITSNGGSKMIAFSYVKFGQIRNAEISLLEKWGFISDEYSSMTCELALDNWNAPESLDIAGIEPISFSGAERINEILHEDGEEEMAELYTRQISPAQLRNRVVLGIQDDKTQEIAGLAYYEVFQYSPSPEESIFQACGFGLHFRPKFEINKAEKRRLIQCALQSMKQLDVQHVLTKMTLKHFDVFAAMVMEGFTNNNLEQLNTLRLTKTL